jgi:hypothetical protein
MSGGTLHDAIKSFTFDEAQIAFIARETLKVQQFESSLKHR